MYKFDCDFHKFDRDEPDVSYMFEFKFDKQQAEEFERRAFYEEEFLDFELSLQFGYGTTDHRSGGDILYGFSSVEVPQNQQREVVEKWHEYFSDLGFELGPIIGPTLIDED